MVKFFGSETLFNPSINSISIIIGANQLIYTKWFLVKANTWNEILHAISTSKINIRTKEIYFKGYLRYNTIFYSKVALDA